MNTLSMITTIFLRSEYFKTALDTAVGEKKEFMEVKECPHPVLYSIFGTEIPDNLNFDAPKGLLGMADLYLVDVLILILILIT